jgi:Flp pilus assembly protein TadG
MANSKQGQRGATLVEAAIILPVLILTIVGLLELGLVFKDFLGVSFAAREGARVGSLAGNDIDADCDIVQAIVGDLGSELVDDGTVTDIRIFKGDQTNGNPVPGFTNVWTYIGNDPTDCTDWLASPNPWSSITRDVSVGVTPLDILGVTINATHNYVTGIPPFTGSINLSETAIQRLEPESFE